VSKLAEHEVYVQQQSILLGLCCDWPIIKTWHIVGFFFKLIDYNMQEGLLHGDGRIPFARFIACFLTESKVPFGRLSTWSWMESA
jgi:hypothetical protein